MTSQKEEFVTTHCGKTLLTIVSKGQAIIAELLRLSQHIPPVYQPLDHPYIKADVVAPQEQKRYKDIVHDFSFIKKQELIENRISSSLELLNLDSEFRDNHMPILERFYYLFEAIYKYASSINQFLRELDAGIVFVQQSFESLLNNQDGRQLMIESIYLYGVMLILLEMKIPGESRERMLMSVFRYKGAGEIPNVDQVCKLMATTNYTYLGFGEWFVDQEAMKQKNEPTNPKNKKPQKPAPKNQKGKDEKNSIEEEQKIPYPLQIFNRIKFPDVVLSMIIGKLRSDDIYLQCGYYPDPNHRSTALAQQAALLFVMLYFKPDILMKEAAIMREIVDKHFPDNWMIAFNLGFVVDLSIAWNDFPAATAAIANSTTPELVDKFITSHSEWTEKCLQKINEFLNPGVLTEEFVLDNIPKITQWLRQTNVTLRWLFLHRTITGNFSPECSKRREIVLGKAPPKEKILLLLLSVAQLEYLLKNIFTRLMEEKEKKWNECKNQAMERMRELGEYFSGEKVLAKNSKDTQLQNYFSGKVAKRIQELEFSNSTAAGRKIHQLIQAFEDVEEFHQISRSLQVKQFLQDTRELLKKMIRYVNIKEEVVLTVTIISDISYCWEIINDYIDDMQKNIKEDPSVIIKMRSTFLKLASMCELPLVRISQAQSQDIISVSQHYSSELVAFVRRTLEIIPISMFSLLESIIEVQTNELQELPPKFPKISLKDFSQLDSRYKLAKLTYEVSKFTEGMLAMEKTLMGVIEVDPQRLLESGIRKELVRQIAESMNDSMVFPRQLTFDDNKKSKKDNNDNNASPLQEKVTKFEEKLRNLASKLDGMFRSFEYIQDYVNLYGLKIWQEEYSRIINYCVEQECNRFLKRKIYDRQSKYQSVVVPIPKFKPLDEHSNTFIGRLAREIMGLTDPKYTIYVQKKSGWFDFEGNECVGITTFHEMHSAVGVEGLIGLDRIIDHIICRVLKNMHSTYAKEMSFSTENGTLMDPTKTNEENQGNLSALFKMLESFKKSIAPPSILHDLSYKSYFALANKLFSSKISSNINQHNNPKNNSQNDSNNDQNSSNESNQQQNSNPNYQNHTFGSILIEFIVKVGRAQLLKKHIQNQLQLRAKLDSPALFSSLAVYNESLLHETKKSVKEQQAGVPVSEQARPSPAHLSRVSDLLSRVGTDDPFEKVFFTHEPIINIGLTLFLLLIFVCDRLQYDPNLDVFTALRKDDALDGMPLCVGLVTVLRQYHSSETDLFLAYFGQFVRVYLDQTLDSFNLKQTSVGLEVSGKDPKIAQQIQKLDLFSTEALPQEVKFVIRFLKNFMDISRFDAKLLQMHIPPNIF